MEDQKTYLAVPEIPKDPCCPLTLGQLRHLLLNRHKNGLQKAVRRIGKRLYLRKDLFEQWIEEQKEGKNG